jgi:hypothetical protein
MTKAKRVLVDVNILRLLLDTAESRFKQRQTVDKLVDMALTTTDAEKGLSIGTLRANRNLRRSKRRTRSNLDTIQAMRHYYLSEKSTKARGPRNES